MKLRYILPVAVAWATGTCAAEMTWSADLYGGLYADGAAGETISPGASSGSSPPALGAVVLEDGDAKYNFGYEVDLKLRADFDDNVAANVALTWDDAKQPPLYRYSLIQNPLAPTEYYLRQTETRDFVLSTLEQVNLELADAAWGVGLTVGGFDLRYGQGGYYNGLVNRVELTSFVAHLDPYGVNLARDWGPAFSTCAVGVAPSDDLILATSHRVPAWGLGLYAATEGICYDLLSLWNIRRTGAEPKAWRYYKTRSGATPTTPAVYDGGTFTTLHAGGDFARRWSYLEIYALAAYHLYQDCDEQADATGGSLFQVYPDVGVRLYWPRLWFRGAALYEAWRANSPDAFGDGVNATGYLLAYGEPQYRITDAITAGAWVRYVDPHTAAVANPQTYLREETPLSLSFGPRFSFQPAAGTRMDVTYGYTKWDASYDDPSTGHREDVAEELKVEIRASF